MIIPTSTVNLILGSLTVISHIGIVIGAVLMIIGRKKHLKILHWAAENNLLLSFVIATLATVSSLFYSDVAGLGPCKLCWYQRTLIYPQVILFAIAAWKNDKKIVLYSAGLSIVGLAIAVYHVIIQAGLIAAAPCSTIAGEPSCAEKYFNEFGYITIPVMSLTVFVMLIMLAINENLNGKKN